MARCFLVSASCTLTTALRSISLWSSFMKVGKSNESFPFGPSISTRRLDSSLLTMPSGFGCGGSKRRNVTSGGTERGARPICDWDDLEVEKVRREC